MRSLAAVIAISLVACSNPSTDTGQPNTQSSATSPEASSVKHSPRTFRARITQFITARQFGKAVALVKGADVDRQVQFDGSGYLAVGQDLIVLPGVSPKVAYDPKRDWHMPGTQDAIQDATWQAAATDFAKRYNLRRAGKGR